MNNYHRSESPPSTEINADTMAHSYSAPSYHRHIPMDQSEKISLFYGSTPERSVEDWLEDCELFSVIYNWPEHQKKSIYGSRLRGDCLNWQAKRLRNHPTESYSTWRESLIDEYRTPLDSQKAILKFDSLKQQQNQKLKHYIALLEDTFDSIYGSHPDSLRDERLLKVFMQGVQPKISEMLLNGTLLTDFTWPLVKEAALSLETRLMAASIGAARTASINVISAEAQDKLTIHEQAIEEIRKKLNDISPSQAPPSTTADAAVNNISHRRVSGREQNSRPQGRDTYTNSNYRGRGGRTDNRRRPDSDRQRQDYRNKNRRSSPRRSSPRRSSPRRSRELPDSDKNKERTDRKKRFDGECHHCNKKGHMKKDCWSLHGKPKEADRQ